jgi:hypothetical protein
MGNIYRDMAISGAGHIHGTTLLCGADLTRIPGLLLSLLSALISGYCSAGTFLGRNTNVCRAAWTAALLGRSSFLVTASLAGVGGWS